MANAGCCLCPNGDRWFHPGFAGGPWFGFYLDGVIVKKHGRPVLGTLGWEYGAMITCVSFWCTHTINVPYMCLCVRVCACACVRVVFR